MPKTTQPVTAVVGTVHAFTSGDGTIKYYGAHKRSGATFAARDTQEQAANDVRLCEAGKPVPMPEVYYLDRKEVNRG